MNNKTTNRTLLPRLSAGAFASLMSGLLAVAFVAAVAYGVGRIYEPAGWIAIGFGFLALQYQFFGGR